MRTKSHMGLKKQTAIKNWLDIIILVLTSGKIRKKEKTGSLPSARQDSHKKHMECPQQKEACKRVKVGIYGSLLSRWAGEPAELGKRTRGFSTSWKGYRWVDINQIGYGQATLTSWNFHFHSLIHSFNTCYSPIMWYILSGGWNHRTRKRYLPTRISKCKRINE